VLCQFGYMPEYRCSRPLCDSVLCPVASEVDVTLRVVGRPLRHAIRAVPSAHSTTDRRYHPGVRWRIDFCTAAREQGGEAFVIRDEITRMINEAIEMYPCIDW
jgi:hypothetical protein